jgi:3-phenylpropionate/trans-cinnamate dioxygenase ferredoxin reductase subunit
MSTPDPIVIVGGGHAGAALCVALAEAGLGARVHLVCDEPVLPYQRPPLSKGFLKNPDDVPALHRAEAWYAEAGITLHRGDAAVAIDRAGHRLQLASGATLPYAQLVLATGARARTLPALQGLDNVALVRNAADAARTRTLLAAAQQVTVLGGGFIGLEIAASALALGKPVTVLEAAPRLLARSLSAAMAEHVLQAHRASGIDLWLGVHVDGFDVAGGRLQALQVDGVRTPVDLLVLGIGAVPEDTLARAAGIACEDAAQGGGVAVDAALRTSDPDVLAIGDCASFPLAGSTRRLRLESVQNAGDQARTAAATLQGRAPVHAALPWFWSDQGGLRLQMAGLLPADAVVHRRPGPTPAGFSLLHYVGERFACVESVNAPMDHMMARKLLEAGKSPDPAAACDPAQPLKQWL